MNDWKRYSWIGRMLIAQIIVGINKASFGQERILRRDFYETDRVPGGLRLW